jgi:hypothetical protein
VITSYDFLTSKILVTSNCNGIELVTVTEPLQGEMGNRLKVASFLYIRNGSKGAPLLYTSNLPTTARDRSGLSKGIRGSVHRGEEGGMAAIHTYTGQECVLCQNRF